MNLDETVNFIKRCINSCNNDEQLGICEDMINRYIVERYEATVNDFTLRLWVEDLHYTKHEKKEAILYSKNLVISSSVKTPASVPGRPALLKPKT
jgi:hypothetical protein